MCQVSVAPIRAEAFHRSEQITQLLFGEACERIDVLGEFTKVRIIYDGYEGWCQSVQLIEIKEPISNSCMVSDWTNTVLINEQKMKVPMGSSLAFFNERILLLGNQHFHYDGFMIDTSLNRFTKCALHKLALKFLNTPYLWGGRSVYGIDCSGFTQLVYRFFNIPLLRDAYQQATQGKEIRLGIAKAGDLSFFCNAKGKITHVGIMLDKDIIIHASGKVRVDSINAEGIISSDTGQLTHTFKVMRRVVL